MPDCVVPDCHVEAHNNLGVRLRRPDTSAIWAPNTGAYVCDTHAVSGARLTVLYEATDAGKVEVAVHGTADDAHRVTRINVPDHAATIAEELTDRLRH